MTRWVGGFHFGRIVGGSAIVRPDQPGLGLVGGSTLTVRHSHFQLSMRMMEFGQQTHNGFGTFGWLALGEPGLVYLLSNQDQTKIRENSNPWLLWLPHRSRSTFSNTPGF